MCLDPRYAILLTIFGHGMVWPVWGTKAIPYGNSMNWDRLQWQMDLENEQSDGAALSSVESMWDQQRVLFEECGSQIYKQDKDFLLKEIIN